MSDAKKSLSPFKIVNAIIALSMMFGIGHLAPIGEVTPLGMQIIGIFLGCIWAWCTVDLIWPSIVALLCLGGLTEYMTIPQAFGAVLSNQNVMITMFFMVIATMVDACGLGSVIATKLLSMKVIAGKPWLFSLLLCYVTALAAPVIKFAPAILLTWGILYNVCDAAGYKKGDKWPAMMVFGIVYSVSFAAALVPTYAGNQANIGMLASVFPNVVFPVGIFEVLVALLTFGTPALYILTCKYILKPDVSLLQNVDLSSFANDSKKLTKAQKIVIWYFVAFLVCLLGASFLPKGLAITKLLTTLNTLGVVLVFLVLAMVIHVDGEPLMNFQKMAGKGILWSLVFMLGTALTLAAALTSQGTNIKPAISAVLIPMIGEFSPFVFMMLVGVIAVVLTNFISNGVVSAILLPITLPFAENIGFSPAALTAIMIIATSFAIMLPSASPVGAMLHGNKEWISFKEATKLSVICMVEFIVLLAFVFIPLATILL